MTEPVDRVAARVLLLDRDERVLLFRGFDPATPEVMFWFTPGGGRDPGESPQECAVRELHEETGLVLATHELGEVVHERLTMFPFDGVTYRQREDYFVVRVEEHEVRTDGFEALEHASIVGHRWWPLPELAGTSETVYPPELLDILRRVSC